MWVSVRARLPQEAKSWLQDSFVRKTPSSPKNTCSRLRARSLIAIIDNNSRQQHLLPKTSFLELPVWDSRCLSLSASQVEVYFMRVIWISPSAHFCKCLFTVLYFGFICVYFTIPGEGGHRVAHQYGWKSDATIWKIIKLYAYRMGTKNDPHTRKTFLRLKIDRWITKQATKQTNKIFKMCQWTVSNKGATRRNYKVKFKAA